MGSKKLYTINDGLSLVIIVIMCGGSASLREERDVTTYKWFPKGRYHSLVASSTPVSGKPQADARASEP